MRLGYDYDDDLNEVRLELMLIPHLGLKGNLMRNKKGWKIAIGITLATLSGLFILTVVPHLLVRLGIGQSRMQSCVENLTKIESAKAQWAVALRNSPGVTPSESDLGPFVGKRFLESFPTCPIGGQYSINAIGVNVTCNINSPGHIL